MSLRRSLTRLFWTTILALAGWLALGAAGAGAQLDIAAVCAPSPATCGGWYTRDVTVAWSVNPQPSEGTTIISGCGTSVYTLDTKGTWTWCEAQNDVDRGRTSKLLRIDKTAPNVSGAAPTREPDANGWYRRPVRVVFSGSDATSGLRQCTATTYTGGDSATAGVDGSCTDVAGNRSALLRFLLRFDATGPDITGATPSRRPDHDGWYNHPVRWRFEATDAVSGLAECPPVFFDGPPSPAAAITGMCRDRAGNTATRIFPFAYDATAPAPPVLDARPRDRAVHLRVRVEADVPRIVIRRSPGKGDSRRSTLYRGRPDGFTDRHVRNGRRYRYTVAAFDRAGNRAAASVAAVPGPRLLSPAPGATLSAPPRLDWTRVRDAQYYNVQLHRDGRKVLTAWPAGSQLQLEHRWRYAGRLQHLRPGRYRWQVWAGYGARRAAEFGPRIGRRSFVVTAPAR